MFMSTAGSRATLLWVFLVLTVSVGAFLYLVSEDKPAATAVLAPRGYHSEREIAETISKILPPGLMKNSYFWIGIEPEKDEQIEVAVEIIRQLKQQNKILRIVVDQELKLKPEVLKRLEFTDLIFAKENLFSLGQKLQELEANSIGYIFISASIYTNTFLKKNPYDILHKKYQLKPVSFSFAYLPISASDEKNMLFGCRAEDHTGTSGWGCIVVNRARFARRSFQKDSSEMWFALMDAATENSYILLLKKK